MAQTGHSKRSRRQGRIWSRHGLDLLVALALFAGALSVRWPWAMAISFPPNEEAAFHAVTAENILAGRGLEVDVLWTYRPAFDQVRHPSHEYWMPLLTGLMTAALALGQALPGVLSNAWQLVQMPGVALGAMVAPITYLFGLRALPDGATKQGGIRAGSRWPSLGAALLVLASVTLSHQSASADSSAVFGLLVGGALMTAMQKPSAAGGYLGTGLLVGLAFLTHSEGLWLLVSIPLAWWLLPTPRRGQAQISDSPAALPKRKHRPRERGTNEEWRRAMAPGLRSLLDLIVAFAILTIPWLVRNYLAFGTPMPQMLLGQVWLRDPVEFFGYVEAPSSAAWLAQGWLELVRRLGLALQQNAGLLVASTFPWGFLALPGLWRLRREWPFAPFLVYGLLVIVVAPLLFPLAALSGTLGRAMGGLLPFLSLAAMYTLHRIVGRIRRLRGPGAMLSVLLVVLLLLQTLPLSRIALPSLSDRSQMDHSRFETISSWLDGNLPPSAVVMTNQGYTLNYAAGHPTSALPGNEPIEATWSAARAYGARALVVVGRFGLYPEILHTAGDPPFQPAAQGDGFEIFWIDSALR